MSRWLHQAKSVLTAMLIGLAPLWAWSQNPPGVVAWLSEQSGSVSLATAGSGRWQSATSNRPLTSGDQVWADSGSKAELHAGSLALRLGEQTNLALTALTDTRVQVQLTQGTLSLRVRTLYADQHVQVDTPNLAFVPTRPGRYRIDVSPNDGGSTTVTVWEGQGDAHGLSLNNQTLRSGQQTVYKGFELEQYQTQSNPFEDGFDRWVLWRDQQELQSPSARYVSREVVGYQALDANGDWLDDPTYGRVWTPRNLSAGWAPYQDGQWVWIEPWGWTWVDNAPWGFAPFHYGRWAWSSARWIWVPGALGARPVYAPALVAFTNGSPARVDRRVQPHADHGPASSWVPLAPNEAYHPSHRSNTASPTVITPAPAQNPGIFVPRPQRRDAPTITQAPPQTSGLPPLSSPLLAPVPEAHTPRPEHRQDPRQPERAERAPERHAPPAAPMVVPQPPVPHPQPMAAPVVPAAPAVAPNNINRDAGREGNRGARDPRDKDRDRDQRGR